MGTPTRYPNGISTADKGSTLFNLPAQDPTKICSYFNDFFEFMSTDTLLWTVTKVGTGTIALTDGSFGELLLTNSAADNDAINVNKVGEFFRPVSGKKMWMKARFKVSDATESDFAIGLAITDTTMITAGGGANGDGCTDGIFFSKDDGDTALDFQTQLDTTTGQNRATAIATVGTAYMTVGFEYDGKRTIEYYVNDVKKGSLTTDDGAGNSYLPDTDLTIAFNITNGTNAAKTMTVDYIYAAIER